MVFYSFRKLEILVKLNFYGRQKNKKKIKVLLRLALFGKVNIDKPPTHSQETGSSCVQPILHHLEDLTCTRASSPSREQDRVGVVPRNPESVTSSTVSPIESTRVAFTKDTMMYASYSSVKRSARITQIRPTLEEPYTGHMHCCISYYALYNISGSNRKTAP